MQCTRPVQADYHKGGYMHPCGYCPACKHNDRVSETFRTVQESRDAKEQWIITLTYEDQHLPLINTSGELVWLENPERAMPEFHPTLLKEDIDRFLNTLRTTQRRAFKKYCQASLSPIEALPEPEIRYYYVGEYGGAYGRPHYHVIVFNLWANLADEGRISELWNRGRVQVETLSPASIHYVTGYIHEKNDYLKGKQLKPFRNKSKGWGLRYEREAKEFHKKNFQPYIHFRGYKIPLPQYYRRRWFNEEDQIKMQERINEWAQTLPEKEVELWRITDQMKLPEGNVPRMTGQKAQTEYSIKSRNKKRKVL